MDSSSQQKIIKSHGHLVSTSALSDRANTKEGVSLEESGPPSPSNGPVINFAEIVPRIYRSSFPRAGNFEHLESLKLKSILTLVAVDYPPENILFMKENGIRHFQIPIPAHKESSVIIPMERIVEALRILLDPGLHPILVHCNKGKHRTGCIVACYRKIQNWTVEAILTEYRKYAGNKFRVLDEQFITAFDQDAALELVKSKQMSPLASSMAMLPTPPSSEKSYWDED